MHKMLRHEQLRTVSTLRNSLFPFREETAESKEAGTEKSTGGTAITHVFFVLLFAHFVSHHFTYRPIHTHISLHGACHSHHHAVLVY